jgi:hypothetical protein
MYGGPGYQTCHREMSGGHGDMGSGEVSLECRVASTGYLKACSIVSEKPAGRGFGVAALQGAENLQVHRKLKDGRSIVGARVRFTLACRPGTFFHSWGLDN